jgi:hypothetical protein
MVPYTPELDSPAGTILDVFVHNEVWDQLFAVWTSALAEQNKKEENLPTNQCCGSGSGLDPDPGRQKMTHKKLKTVDKFRFLDFLF